MISGRQALGSIDQALNQAHSRIADVQAQIAEATKYAEEKYGAEVFAFDGQSDGAIMTQNVDQVLAQGMDAATMQLWEPEAAVPAVERLEALEAKWTGVTAD